MARSLPPHILIVSDPEDYHSLAVSEALKLRDVDHDLWYMADFPSRQTGSSWIEPGSEHWEMKGPDLDVLHGKAPSAIWMRRPGQPALPPEIAPADRSFAYRECKAFLDSLKQQIGIQAFWVNAPASFLRSSSKLEQLRAAVRCGFGIPKTLMSNDPQRIREFLATYPGRVIYKAFYPAFWDTGAGVAAVFSSPISAEDLPEDDILRATPGIFQVIIPKRYELRITAIGQHLFAVKVDSQSIPSARLDWRAARERVPLEPVTLPNTVAAACHRLMEDLGLSFGCFDIILTPDGNYVFLEVNEMGAFLWIEEQNPEIRLLDSFSALLVQGRRDFEWSPSMSKIALEDVRDTALQRAQRAATTKHHVLRPPVTVQE